MIYNNSIVFKNLSLTEYWKPYYIIIQIPNSWDGTKLYLRFKPYYEGAGVASTGTMYIDNINLYELSRDIEFDVATKLSQEWLRVIGSEYELSNGSLKEYVDGFRFKCSIFWDHLTADFESKRSKVMSALLLFFIPHIDYNWGILVKPDGSIKREYFHDKYVCHVGGIDMLGIELLNNDSCLLVEDSFIGDEEFLFYNYEDDIDPIL
jgi:hypothetical protein